MRCEVSVVIPTFSRRARLARVLEGLEGQSVARDRFEVVIVDDGSTDHTADWLREQKFGFALRVFEQSNQGPAAARNKGVGEAESDLVLFLDDDVVPGTHLVGEHLKVHAAESDIVLTGPMSSLPSYRQPWVAWEQVKLEAQYRAMIRGDYAPSYRQFWTGNSSLAKKHFEAAGGFDRSFPRGEDVELGQRLAERGLKFRFNPAAFGLHYAERSLDSWSAMHRSYGKLEVQIFRRQGEGHLEGILAENYSRLHPLNKILVRGCVGHEKPFALATNALRGLLKLSEAAGKPALAGAACGALANLLYWSASADALGGTTMQELFQRDASNAASTRSNASQPSDP
jgi:GT2 family glycosyltransferase